MCPPRSRLWNLKYESLKYENGRRQHWVHVHLRQLEASGCRESWLASEETSVDVYFNADAKICNQCCKLSCLSDVVYFSVELRILSHFCWMLI